LRLLHLSSARAFGGGERHLADLAVGLAARGHEVFVALPAQSPLRNRLDALPPQNVLTLGVRGALDIRGALRLARLAREKKVEVIHAHVARDYVSAALAARRVYGSRLVITRHVLFPMSRAHRLSLSNVSRVIAVSEAVARALREQDIFDADKIRVVANGVDLQRFALARAEFERTSQDGGHTSQKSGAGERVFRVGTVGELSEVKGQEEFVRAAALVAEKFGGHVEFVIAGEDASRSGDYRARLESLIAELGLSECVSLLGRRDDVERVFASLDVFVSASRSEAFGMAMAEAAACGVPVVATATEGAREVVEEGLTGKLVPVGDVRALAASVLSLLEDKELRHSLGARALESALQRFGLERMIEATERVYTEALARNG
jgi:L-malate glycosyltransferase